MVATFRQEDDSMTPIELRAAAKDLHKLHQEVEWCFGRWEARQHSLVYIKGLLLHTGRKSIEPIALRFAHDRNGEPPQRKEVGALQHFITDSPWAYQDLQHELQRLFTNKLVPSASQWPIGTVGVIDESGDEKSGEHSCGAATQYFGRIGKTETCQIGVFLVGVVPAGTTLLDHQLFLPQAWAQDKKRRRKTRVPGEIKFRSKPQLAIDLLRRTLAAGQVKFDWLTADALYGKSGRFLDGLEELQQRYVVETSCDTTFWTVDPTTQVPAYCGQGAHPVRPKRDSVKRADVIAARLPEDAWQTLQLREGAKGPLVAQFARVRVWAVRHDKPGPAVWLMFRRELESREVKYFVCNADEATPLEHMALASAARYRVEEFFQDGKQYLGLADYEARGWSSWHHHMSLVGLAHFYVVLTKQTLKRSAPALTLDQAIALIQAAMDRPHLSIEDAQRLLEYHTQQNAIALKSHRKSWQRRHKELKPKLLL